MALLSGSEPVKSIERKDSESMQIDEEMMPPPVLKNQTSNRMLIRGMDSGLYNRIWGDNESFVRLKVFYDFEYFQFLRDYINLFAKLPSS